MLVNQPMPFLAFNDGTLVVPEEIDDGDGADLKCPVCDGKMHIRSSYYRDGGVFVARHFVHDSEAPGSNTSCSMGGGESNKHQRMKSIALSKLKSLFPNYEEAGVEVTIRNRRADVALSFEQSSPHPRYGEGIVAEVQFRHEEKNKRRVEEDFIASGYTVYWLETEDFSKRDVEFSSPITPTVHDQIPKPEGDWLANKDINPLYRAQTWYEPPTISIHLPRKCLEYYRSELHDAWSIGHRLYKRRIDPSFKRPDHPRQTTLKSATKSHSGDENKDNIT